MSIKRNKWLVSAAGAAALSLTLTACGGGDSDGGSSADESKGAAASADSSGGASGDAAGDTAATTGIITANGSEPQNPLIPANTVETGGGKIIDMAFAKLVDYDSKGESVMDVAKSIESKDNKTWTITINDDRKFSDGSKVTAKSFVDAWNYSAHIDQNYLASYFFEPIEGYADVHPAEEGAKAKAEKMSGLKVIDDTTFEVTLEQPYTAFPQRLGYSAFAPLPESFFKDPKAFGEKPVGNGPYMVESWTHKQGAKLRPNPHYVGDSKPKNGGVDLTFYQKPEPAYTDLRAGKLDVMDTIPTGNLGTYEKELGDRAIKQDAGIFQSFTFPMYTDAPYAGDSENAAKIRKAISMSIDREAITKNIFQGTRVPAKDFSSPVVEGYDDTVCGELCESNDEKAKQLLEEAGGWDGSTLTIAYNADGGHQAWVDAVCGEIKNGLGIDCTGKAYPEFKSLRDDVTKQKMDGAFRSGWQMDYPALENFLTPLYKTGASSNDGGYTNKEFDKLLEEGDAAKTPEESMKKYKEAEKILVEDAPVVPLWYSTANGGFSDKVENVKFDVFSVPEYHNITKN